MSNKQIAINLWSAGCSKSDIERALDEAEKRGMDYTREAAYQKGKIGGQRDMRERAAKEAEKCIEYKVQGEPLIMIHANIFENIRALPIEGE